MQVGAQGSKPTGSVDWRYGGEWEIHRGFNYSEGVEDPAVGVGVEAGEGPYRERGQGWEARVLERPQPSSRTQPIFRA